GGLVVGCGGNTPESNTPASPSNTASTTAASTTSNTETAVATKPDHDKAIAHLKTHVKYPATKADLVKACADSNEFTAGEKKWFESNLPDGNYKSADDVIAAVKP